MASGIVLRALTTVLETGAVHSRRGRELCKSFRNQPSLAQLQRKQDTASELFWNAASSDRLLLQLSAGVLDGVELPAMAAQIVVDHLHHVLAAMDDAGLLPGDEAGLQALFERALDACAVRIAHSLFSRHSVIDPSGLHNSALRRACKAGDIAFVRLLLTDARVDPADEDNQAITHASCSGHTAIVRILLADERVNPTSSNSNGAFKLACVNGHADVVQLLLADGRVDPNFPTGAPPIIWAAHDGRTEIVRLLLADGRASPCSHDDWAIGSASKFGHVDIVRLLLADPRVNPAGCDDDAIRCARARGHQEVVDVLIADGRASLSRGTAAPLVVRAVRLCGRGFD